MSKGRPAHESAEKSHVAKSIEHDMRRREQPDYDDYFEGISIPERPSKKAIELMKKGKGVAFT